LGSLVITPIISRKDNNAKLTILHAKKNGRAGFIISSPIILYPSKNNSVEKYNPEIDQVLRHGASLKKLGFIKVLLETCGRNWPNVI
jgi:tRNA1(Val) A37 N6-methylase TrmN6